MIETILRAKGRTVETVRPEATVGFAIHELTTRAIGALVVSPDGERIDGVLSERDIVRGLARHGAALLNMRVSEVMSHNVPTCSPAGSVKDVMETMTHSRHRHVPVVEDGRLCGIVSIGDVVKNRLEELELQTNVLREAYIAHR